MRRLHPVGLHEKFVASGEYRDNQQTAQKWTLHEVGEGGLLCRSEGVLADGFALDETLLDEQGRVLRLNRERFVLGKRVHKETHLFADRRLETTEITRDNLQPHHSETEFANDSTYLAHVWGSLSYAYALWGFRLRALATLIEADLMLPSDEKTIPLPLQRPTETIVHANKTVVATRYDWGTWRIWLDNHHIPLQLNNDLEYSIQLVHYAHR